MVWYKVFGQERMNIKIFSLILIIAASACLRVYALDIPKQDIKSRDLKYKYDRLKEQEKYKKEGKILNLVPSGYMTVEEYEQMSEYKDKSTLELDIPKVSTPSDFKYVPHPTYKIVKYNNPPGGTELRIDKRIYTQRQINAQGVVSPDFTLLVYPAIYYYTDSASVASDMFVIPLEGDDSPLDKILKANVMKRIPKPILSTDKSISNYASFMTLTPVDFSRDGKKLLIKEKIGSREDGIWKTTIYVYDFSTKVDYDLSEIRDAITYFWKEYMDLNLQDYRWDIYPLGFLKSDPNRVAVQAIAFTGSMPVFLGTWSIDTKGNQSRVVSFEKDVEPLISANGYKVVKDGVEEYEVIDKEEKSQKKEDKIKKKQFEQYKKERLKEIDYEYKYAVKYLEKDYKMEARDYRKLRSLSGVKDSDQLKEAYRKFLVDQYKKDIEKSAKDIEKHNKKLEKINQKLDKLYEQIGNTSSQTPPEGSTLDEYMNGTKEEKKNPIDDFEIEKFKYDGIIDDKSGIPDGKLNYTDTNGKTLNLRPGDTPANDNTVKNKEDKFDFGFNLRSKEQDFSEDEEETPKVEDDSDIDLDVKIYD